VPKRGAVREKSASIRRDGDGNEVGNLILCGLSRTDCPLIYPSLELVRLKLHQVLHEAGEAIKSVYFLNDGLVSLLTVQKDGTSVEVGLIGKEGVVGVPVLFGFQSSNLRTVIQGDATGYRIAVDTLRGIFPQCPWLLREMRRFSLILGMQTTQIAACNRIHGVEERLARWLLMCQDRIAKKNLPLTQEFLSQMLGVRRASVSVAAGIFQKAEVIAYNRGSVTILNRSKLEEAACDCYAMIEEQKHLWQAEAQSVRP
jgi:CRP-like cAMP-binding protein